ncbi:MAG: HEAT repeat domain-containing protein [Phycisphaerales bacterium]|nr:MAG: HEAT repeat domain-containing protein [Phycisphaerales bacterium]
MTNTHAKTRAAIHRALLLICLAVIGVGCKDSSESLLGDFYVTSVAPVRAEAKHVIDQALADSDPVARVNAIEVVGTTGRVDFMPKVQRLLQDSAVPVRFATALAVGDLRYAPAKTSLTPLLKDQDSNVIIAASYAMGRLGAEDYYRVLIEGTESKDQTVRANAVLLLGKTGERKYLDVIKAAQEDRFSSDKVRFQALEARARLGDEEVLQRLWAVVYSSYANDRAMGVRAMGALGTARAKEILMTKLDDTVPEVRVVAAEELGRLGETIGEEEVLDVFEQSLISSLEKQDIERIHVLVALAIGQIRTPALIKRLPQLLKNDSKYVRIAAAKAVFQCDMM